MTDTPTVPTTPLSSGGKTATPSNQRIAVPDRYARLGVANGFNPTPTNGMNVILEALPGHGKTTLLMSRPETIVMDFDRACGNVIAPRAAYVPLSNYTDYEAVKTALLEDAAAGHPPFKCVAFDTADTFLQVLDRHMLVALNASRTSNKLDSIYEFGLQGAGYIKMGNALIRELIDYSSAGYAWTLACHMRVRTETIGETKVVERRCSMAPSIMEMLVKHAEVKARLYRSMEDEPVKETRTISLPGGKTKTIKADTGKTELRTRHWLCLMPTKVEEDDDTKHRLFGLQGVLEIPLTDGWNEFEKAYKLAVAEALKLDSENARQSAPA